MRVAALLVALFTILVGMVGLVSPDSLTAVRRLYFATPIGLYSGGAVRVAMGLVLILSAPTSRAPMTLRALGAVVCMQGLAATLFGPDRARAILEWEAMHTALLRAGALVALAAGGFVAFAVTKPRRTANLAHEIPERTQVVTTAESLLDESLPESLPDVDRRPPHA